MMAGCSTITPMEKPEEMPGTADKARDAVAVSDGWNTPGVVRDGKSSVVLVMPSAVPDSVRRRKVVGVSLEPGATIKDIVAILGNMGFPIILADNDAGTKQFYLPTFNGTLGQLLDAISRANDVWFAWHDGTIVIASTERIAVSVPQDGAFADVLSKGLTSLGVKENVVMWQAGMVSLDVTPSQFRKTRQYLARLTNNAAFVTLQLAVVNVTLNQNAKQGIDWEKLSIAGLTSGSPIDIQNWQKALNPAPAATATSATGTASTTPTTDTAVDLVNRVTQLTLGGGSLQGLVFGNRFNFSGMFNYLQTYGNAETKQNVLLKTITGNKVELKSLTQIPYVKEIGVAASTSANNSTALGSTQTDKADDGITVEMTPSYDSAANTVTVSLKLAIKAVLAFNELSAGNQLGKLTQPTTAERSFNDLLTMRPGQTVVVGGLSYDSVSNSYGSPLFLQGTKAESQALKVDRQSMFIVMRSSVERIGQLQEQSDEPREYLAIQSEPSQVEATPLDASKLVSAEEPAKSVKPTKQVRKSAVKSK
jgi:hypothetical protein